MEIDDVATSSLTISLRLVYIMQYNEMGLAIALMRQ